MKLPVDRIKNLHIILGMVCNVRCKMCYQKEFTSLSDPAVWQEKLLPLYPQLDHIVIQGGEPTIIPSTKKLIDIAMSLNDNVRFSFMTNGKLFGESWAELFVQRGNYVNFSINASDETTYEDVMQYSSWKMMYRNLSNLVELRSKSSSDLEIRTSFVAFNRNIHQLEDFIRWSDDMGVDKVRIFFDLTRLSEENRKLAIPYVENSIKLKDQVEVEIDGLEAFYSRLKRQPVPKELLQSFGCKKTFEWLYIDMDGGVSFCCLLGKLGKLGNIKEDSIEFLWNNEKAQEIRANHLDKTYTYCSPAYCKPIEIS